VQAGASALRKLHAVGGWHGFPLARNIVGEPDALGFIDFEEDPGAKMSSVQCRTRDLILYLHSLGGIETRFAGTMDAAINAYLKAGPLPVEQARHLRRVRRFCMGLSPLAWTLWSVRRKLGRDLRDGLVVWRALKDLRTNEAETAPRRRRGLRAKRNSHSSRTSETGSRVPFG